MKPGDLKYYEKYSSLAPLLFAGRAIFTRSKLRKVALLNRQRDYLLLADNSKRMTLHRRFHEQLIESICGWDSYDYGEGYFYQSLAAIGITGFRDTDARVQHMDLAARLAGMRVLEIGCNTGFLSLSIAGAVGQVAGFDINPYLISVARLAADYLDVTNVDFEVSSFEDYGSDERFDAVLSFANHSTYDQNTRQTIEEYFEKCRRLIRPDGLLLFESHPPQHEGEGLKDVCALIAMQFEIKEQRVLDYGTFLDRGRTFIVARRH